MKDKYGNNIEMNLNNKEIDTLIKRKTIKGIIIGTVLGGIITGGVGVTAVTLTAKEIKYTPSNQTSTATNADEAINELYEMTEELKDKAIYGAINLGSESSINITDIVGAENIGKYTNDDFIVKHKASSVLTGSFTSGSNYRNTRINLSDYAVNYNNETGVLNISGGTITAILTDGNNYSYHTWNLTPSFEVYILLKNPL